ncbi:MAG TPA: hypothetical protein VFZ69_15795 [Longimicrobiales bacterium]
MTRRMLLALALAACSPHGSPETAETELPEAIVPPATNPVLRIEATALGSFRPGEAIDIVARVSAAAVVDTAQFTITLPELAEARRTGWDQAFAERDDGVVYPALEDVLGRLAPEMPLLLRSRVVFRAPGLYRVSMVARARTRPISDRPVPAVAEAFHSFRIRIGEEGGGVETEMDSTRAPIGSGDQGRPVRVPDTRAPLTDPAADLALPAPVHAAGTAPDYRAVIESLDADVTGDGVAERVVLSVDAELDARGRPLFEDGHRWRIMVRGSERAFTLYDEFVPMGDVRVHTRSREIDERGAPPALHIAWRSHQAWGERRVRYDPATRTFITESVVRVVPLD